MKHIKLFEKILTSPMVEILDHIYDIGSGGKRFYTYLHTTDEDTCKKVLEDGFEFYIFCLTTDEISNDVDTLNFKLSMRKAYGDCVIVMQFLHFIDDGIDMAIKEPYYNEEEDLIYTLPSKYVRGFFNKETGEFVDNPTFELL